MVMEAMRTCVLLALVVMAGAAGVAVAGLSAGSGVSTARASATGRIIVTRDAPGLPRGCRTQEFAERIDLFLRRFSRGAPRLDRFFDFRRDFVGQGSFSGPGPDARNGRSAIRTSRGLLRYFARRRRQNERMQLKQLQVSYGNGLGQYQFVVERQADDLPGGPQPLNGKGAFYCPTRQIAHWAAAPGIPGIEICPMPSTPPRPEQVVACSPPQPARDTRSSPPG